MLQCKNKKATSQNGFISWRKYENCVYVCVLCMWVCVWEKSERETEKELILSSSWERIDVIKLKKKGNVVFLSILRVPFHYITASLIRDLC